MTFEEWFLSEHGIKPFTEGLDDETFMAQCNMRYAYEAGFEQGEESIKEQLIDGVNPFE